MQASRNLFVITLLACVLSVCSSPLLSEQATSKCTSRDLAIVRRTVSDEAYFCKWWLSDVRTRSPFLEFTPTRVTNLCRCITPGKTITKHKRVEQTEQATVKHRVEKRQTKASCGAEMSIQFTEPWNFCVFYNSYPRTTSPFTRYSAKDLVKLCNCVEGRIVSTSTKKTSTKKALTSTTLKKTSSSPSKVPSTSSKSISSSSSKTSSRTLTTPSWDTSQTFVIVLPTPWTPPASSSRSVTSSSEAASISVISASSGLTSSESTTALRLPTTTQASTTAIASATPLLAGFIYATNSGDRGLDNFPLQGKDNGGAIYINSTETGYYALEFTYDSATQYVHVGSQSNVLCYQYYTYRTDNPTKANNNSNIVSLSPSQLASGLDQNYTPLLCTVDVTTSALQCTGKSADGRDLTKFATSDDHGRAGIRTGGGYLHVMDPAAIIPPSFPPLDLIAFGASVADPGPNPSSSSSTVSESRAIPSTTASPLATESSSSVGTTDVGEGGGIIEDG